jgi:hypothetical protein
MMQLAFKISIPPRMLMLLVLVATAAFILS